jgi:hypothetical protein
MFKGFRGIKINFNHSSPDIGLNDLPKPTFWRSSRFSTNDRVMM